MSPSIRSIGRAFDAAHRAGDVAALLLKFGFGEFLGQTGLDKYLGKDREGDESIADQPLKARVRLLLEALGPTFIKAGQILSTRPDLIPPEWAEEFAKLQSEIPPDPWEGEEGVKARIEQEFGGDLSKVFADFEEEAFAAASIAQVHRATLKDGTKVAVKVLRPGIRAVLESDIELLRWLLQLTRHHFGNVGFDADAVVREFEAQLARETDFTIEAAATVRMRRDFADSEGVDFPKVYTEHTTRSVLVLEFVEGTLLRRLDPETMTKSQLERIAQNAADAVFRQCLDLGFFHADPHPGNIIVRDDQSLCFVDCGMTGLIDPTTKAALADLVHSTIDGEQDKVVKIVIEMSGADPAIGDDRAFRSDVWQYIDRFQDGSLESFRMGKMLEDFFATLRQWRLRCPPDIVYLIKSLATIEGVAERMAPEFDLVGYVRPYVDHLVRERYSLRAMAERAKRTAMGYTALAEELPGEISDLLRQIKQNRLSVNFDHQGLEGLTREVERASMNISWSLVVASFIVGAALLILADGIDRSSSYLSTLAAIVFVVALVIGAGRLLISRFRKP